MKDITNITIKDPASGRRITWGAMNKASAIKQAKLEAKKGAIVYVHVNGELVYTNADAG